MGIKHFKANEHCPEAKSAVKFSESLTLTTLDRQLPSETGARRLMPCVYTVEKGKPYTYTAYGPSSCYVIEGDYELEDQSTPGMPIRMGKGDVILVDEGTVVKGSSPSKARVFGITYIEGPMVITDTVS